MENNLVQILLEIKADGAATRAAVEALAGPTGRVTVLEQQQKSTATWSRWYNLCIVPSLGIGHALLRHFKVNI